jgi:hypothetical protein
MTGPESLGLFALLLVAVVGAAAWWLLRRSRSARAAARRPVDSAARAEDAFTDWADATCPICLGLGLASVRPETP